MKGFKETAAVCLFFSFLHNAFILKLSPGQLLGKKKCVPWGSMNAQVDFHK